MTRPQRKVTDPGKCKKCGAPILWTKTIEGRWNPVDVTPVPNGNLSLRLCGGEFGILQQRPWVEGAAGRRFVSHFSTCPNAEEFRGNRSSREEPPMPTSEREDLP